MKNFCKVNESNFKSCFGGFLYKDFVDNFKDKRDILLSELLDCVLFWLILRFVNFDLLLWNLLSNFRCILNSFIFNFFPILLFNFFKLFVNFIKSLQNVWTENQNLTFEFPVLIICINLKFWKKRQDHFNWSFWKRWKYGDTFCFRNGRGMHQSFCCIFKIEEI